ncbi:MAG: ABC transporter ATP-binding protein [Acidimicrobiales bacterium]
MTALTPGQRSDASPEGTGPSDALVVDHLDVTYRVRGHDRRAIADVSFRIARGESYGLVGESGSGKSTLAVAVERYLPRNGRVSAGSISVNGRDVLGLDGDALRDLRSKTVSMVYQEPGRALNPSIRVGRQVAEVFEVAGLRRSEALERAEAMLTKVQISDPGSVMRRYPHQISGGMAQRVVVAMALATDPSLLILDEPTTALDATVEAEILDLVAALRTELGSTVLFISHNLAVIAKMCDRVGVLYAGELVEEGPAGDVFDHPRHPYTVGLLRCIPHGGLRKDHGRLDPIPGFLPSPGAARVGCIFAPRCALADDRCRSESPPMSNLGDGRLVSCFHHDKAADLPRSTPVELALLEHPQAPDVVVRLGALSKTFHAHGEDVKALVDIDLELRRGETLGLVGESGSGKTTLARVLLGLIAPDSDSVIELDGGPLASDVRKRGREQLKALQIVFQNPDSALNRRHSVRRIIGRSVRKLAGLSGEALRQRVIELVEAVRMEQRHLLLRPSQLSGGLKQRVAIARAFGGEPRIVVCDEPTSALDVSVQAAILNLLVDLQLAEQVTYLFISHDLRVVGYLSDRIAVLYLGRLMEVGPADIVFSGPHHPYTEALVSSVPSIGEDRRTRIRLSGEIPSAANPPVGCVFHTRCPRRLETGVCETVEPPLVEVAPGHLMRCHIDIDSLRRLQAAEAPLPPAVAASTD